jgi:hypothetical protein
LENKQKDVLCPRVTHCVANKKKILFPFSFWGIYYLLSFSIISESLKNNKIMLCYKGGLSVADILVPSARNTWMLRAKGHMQEKDTQEKSFMGQGVKK